MAPAFGYDSDCRDLRGIPILTGINLGPAPLINWRRQPTTTLQARILLAQAEGSLARYRAGQVAPTLAI